MYICLAALVKTVKTIPKARPSVF